VSGTGEPGVIEVILVVELSALGPVVAGAAGVTRDLRFAAFPMLSSQG
jgi:hypothetical protein